MQYTKFGNTGVSVSRLGFGCMRLPMTEANGQSVLDEEAAIAMLRKGYELGIDYFDTAYLYHNGLSEVILGKAIKGFRENISIASKSPWHLMKKTGDYRRILEEQLKRLDTSYLDFYHFHGVCYDSFFEVDKRVGWYKDALKAKEEGLIRHISVSFHTQNSFRENQKTEAESDEMIKLIDTDYFETVLCQYNAIDQTNARAMEHAKKKGMGVAVMGPLGGGRVSGLPKEVAQTLGIDVGASVELGLRFVESNPNVDIILSGMSSTQQLIENATCISNIEPLSEKEVQGIKDMMAQSRRLAELYCTGCNYCMPCPQNVNIPYIFQTANYHNIYGLTEYAKKIYSEIGTGWIPGKRADACNGCGACEKNCPQHIHIREQLQESDAVLR